MSNFIILIGGPGLFESCDPKHDKTWLNYFYPVQVAAELNLYEKGSETVHWVVYEPAYKFRWLEDYDLTMWENFTENFTGRALHRVRKAAADKVKKSGANNFLGRIKMLAHSYGITYKGITKPEEFWTYIASFPKESINRVWYSGHATRAGFILRLIHDSCVASYTPDSLLPVLQIEAHKNLKDRFSKKSKEHSKFYGCNTAPFAKKWHEIFGETTEGADSSITFKDIFGAKKGILKRLETTPTGLGSPKWTIYQ